MKEILSLYELNLLIRSTVEVAFPETFFVTAEIAKIDIKNHCYIDLVDKIEETIRAEMKAIIWSSRYRALSEDFKEATGIELTKGIKILFEAYINFHERYGLKLNIINIDPSYTIGELAIKRREILRRLEREGLKDRNKSIEFPLVPQRIGIVSSGRAAGYEDLMTHLMNNPYGYKFTCRLYEAIMQGDSAEASIVEALNLCHRDSPHLDAIVIVRGGGSQTDLHCFDSYEIARAIAFMPIPVISGIGHERDITVVDEVANLRAKTPTAVADILITKMKGFEDSIDSMGNRLFHGANKLIADIKGEFTSLIKNLDASIGREIIINTQRINAFIRGLRYSIKFLQARKRLIIQEATKLKILSFNEIKGEERILTDFFFGIKNSIQRQIKMEDKRIKSREDNINHLNPRNILKRGYSITRKSGRVVKSVSEIHLNDTIETTLYDGEIISSVKGKG